MRRWVIVGSVVVAFAALASIANAQSRVVWAGGQPSFQTKLGKQFRYGEALSFFPNTVKIHVGDTIAWKGMSVNFHTIDLPGPSGRAIPLIAPIGGPVSGVLDAAGNPFWFDSHAPQLGLNPALLAPSGGHTYNGTARVDAGLPFGPPATFSVKFTKAGRYAYFCDVHPGMRGLVVVVPKGKPIPSAAQNAGTVRAQQAAATAAAARLARTKIHGNRVSLGIKGPGNVEILRMFQGVTHVKVGTTITFAMATGSFETHTVSFGPQPYLNLLVNGFDTPAIDPRSVFPSSPPGSGAIALAKTSHGNGFANTGALSAASGSTLPPLAKIKFTQKGTYRFQCLIHPFMRGVVVVQ